MLIKSSVLWYFTAWTSVQQPRSPLSLVGFGPSLHIWPVFLHWPDNYPEAIKCAVCGKGAQHASHCHRRIQYPLDENLDREDTSWWNTLKRGLWAPGCSHLLAVEINPQAPQALPQHLLAAWMGHAPGHWWCDGVIETTSLWICPRSSCWQRWAPWCLKWGCFWWCLQLIQCCGHHSFVAQGSSRNQPLGVQCGDQDLLLKQPQSVSQNYLRVYWTQRFFYTWSVKYGKSPMHFSVHFNFWQRRKCGKNGPRVLGLRWASGIYPGAKSQ